MFMWVLCTNFDVTAVIYNFTMFIAIVFKLS